VVGHAAVAIAVGGGVALLLHWKAPLHEFVARIGETDVKAIMRFVLVALVIYPVLPDQAYGPYGVLNPQQIWLMVVLIVGISLGGYVAYKLLGRRPGAVLAGTLGGLISSTATTIAYARRTRQTQEGIRLAAVVIVSASAVALARVLVEIAVVAPTTFWRTAPPVGIMFGWMAAIAAGTYGLTREDKAEPVAPGNPAEVGTALLFAGLYALVLLGVAAARDSFGAGGLYGVAVLSGLHDLDAITLSTSRFVEQGAVGADQGWRLILTASLANLVLKGVAAAVLGQRRLLAWIVVPFAAALLGGMMLLFLWPAA
jgi:uncharacterized membrane protein (DUF4010 family)